MDELKAFMEVQRADYARALPGKVAALEALWAGTFGFREAGEQAGTLETVAQEALEAGSGLTPDQAERIVQALGALRLSLPEPP
jgi:hypothetical protein